MLPLGKLPPDLLARLLASGPPTDARVVLGPGIGLDCAVVEFGDRLLVAKTDPITFATDEIGWYAVQIASNDIATTGARPQWFLASLLLPEGRTAPALVESIFEQIRAACAEVGASLIGGHTEITHDLRRPILVGTMLGEVARDRLITPAGAAAGDAVLLTKGIPIEGAAIVAREKADVLADTFSAEFLERVRGFLHAPGIGVVRDALAAVEVGGVTAMHDPTEGGLASGVWELAEASGLGVRVRYEAIPILPEAAVLCRILGLDPLATIASGALLIAVRPERAAAVQSRLAAEGIASSVVGEMIVGAGVEIVRGGRAEPLPRPERDEIARLFE